MSKDTITMNPGTASRPNLTMTQTPAELGKRELGVGWRNIHLYGGTMEYHELRNYSKLYSAKPSPKIAMSILTFVPKELGFIGTPKFVAKMQGKERHWNKIEFKEVEERGIVEHDFLDGIRRAIVFYTTLIATCGKPKALRVYPKVTEKLGLLTYRDFMPTAKDFLACPDSWDAFRRYYLELFRAYDRARIMDIEILQNSDTDLQIEVSYCAYESIWREIGYPEITPTNDQVERAFYPQLIEDTGGHFERASCLCNGDSTCDWHFCRYKTTD